MIREYPVASVDVDTPMSDEYRTALLRLLADQTRAEAAAARIYARWVGRAPGAEEKRAVATLVHEETQHGSKVQKLLADLGVAGDEVRGHRTWNMFYFLSMLYLRPFGWLDIVMMMFLVDRGANYLVEDFAESSYAPWCGVAREIIEEEKGHFADGRRFLERQIARYGARRCQRRLDRWWPVVLNMFGPPRTKNTDDYIRLGLKFRTNEARRRAFRDGCEPEIVALGLAVPRLIRTRYPYF